MSGLSNIVRRDGVTRRDLLRGLGVAIAAVQASCYSRPGDGVETWVDDRPELTPGGVTRYATALALDGFATGVIAECHDGWPTKLDGNPAHPATRGGSTPILQARVLDLYDPQRTIGGDVAGLLRRLRGVSGPVWLVLPPHTSPTIAALLARIAARVELHVVWCGGVVHDAAYAGTRLAFGEPAEVQIDPAHARVIAALDADWLATMPMSPAWARAAAPRRAPGDAMSRLWMCEPMPTPTGTLCDERLPARAGDVVAIAALVAARVGALAVPDALISVARGRAGAEGTAWAARLAEDLLDARGAGAVVVGDRQPAVVHALARAIDAACGNAASGAPVSYTAPARLDAGASAANATAHATAAATAAYATASLADLAAALRTRGSRPTVIVVDANPVAIAPRALDLGALLRDAIVVGAWRDETSAAAATTIPLAHELEAWSDPRAWDGTAAIAQPIVRPRFEVASPIEVLAALAGDSRDAQVLVRETSGMDVPAWRAALASGVVVGSAAPARTLALRDDARDAVLGELARALDGAAPAYELARAPSLLHDGRFAGNAWLQELPHPITKQMWGNAALMSAQTADELGVASGDRVELSTDGGALAVPALVVPGHADRAITVELGYGRAVPGVPIADGIGGNAYALTPGAVTARAGRGRVTLALAQLTLDQHDRPIAPSATLAELRAAPDLAAEWRTDAPPSWLPESATLREGLQWAMSIDTSLCTGCNACVVACQAENNTPTVGPEHAARGRRMHWLRIDSYVADDGYVHQPVPCMQCEHAPCEYVCPVGATAHSPDGLNEQVYNRCVGTRFCSNNCPYKVRRFNWFSFERPATTRALQYNPDVTVRSRGVMEKCTYCVQRIRGAEHTALVEKREIRPGEVVTACQAACPTTAIAFGAISHPGPLAVRRADARRYELLHHLGTRPRTQHLLRVRNPRSAP